MQHQTLTQYLTSLKEKFKNTLSQQAWVIAEISQFNVNKGHGYFSLIEQSDGRETAKCDAFCFANKLNALQQKFQSSTGMALQKSMKVLINVSPAIHEKFGLQLTINDINPQFSLGDMEAKMRGMREALKKSGKYDKNKSVPVPDLLTRVAVITPEGAAGREDFQKEADILHNYGVTEFVYFFATFQGERAQKSVAEALVKANQEHKRLRFDAIFIVRGGGNSADMFWLNDLTLANYVCSSYPPVFTGIGHERDSCILDEVANTKFGTPSKAISYVVRRTQEWLNKQITSHAKSCDAANYNIQSFQSQISKRVGRIGYIGATTLQREMSRFEDSTKTQLRSAKSVAQAFPNRIIEKFTATENQAQSAIANYDRHMTNQVRNAFKQARGTLRTIVVSNTQSVQRLSSEASRLIESTASQSEKRVTHSVTAAKTKISHYAANLVRIGRYIDTFSPSHTMRTGYAMIEMDGHHIRRADELKDGKATIQFFDGDITVNLTKEN